MHADEIDLELLQWVPIPLNLKDGLAEQTLPKRKLKVWALVLQARNIQYRCEKVGFKYQLLVPTEHYQVACKELQQYETENHNWPPPLPAERPLQQNSAATIWVFIALAVFHNLTIQQVNPMGNFPLDWQMQGNADAAKILRGEWWRLFTALTLHSGAIHLTSNILFGAIFMLRLGNLLGSGLAWFLVLCSGALGNWLNAMVQAPNHQSIGASTAVFATIGLLAAINMFHFRVNRLHNWRLPFAAALGLLALLGASGENTDIGAHLFGFISGLGLGFAAAPLIAKLPRQTNLILAAFSASLMVCAWWCAI